MQSHRSGTSGQKKSNQMSGWISYMVELAGFESGTPTNTPKTYKYLLNQTLTK